MTFGCLAGQQAGPNYGCDRECRYVSMHKNRIASTIIHVWDLHLYLSTF